MGLFNKHKDDENDFILDFTSVPNDTLNNAENDAPEITPWDKREHTVTRGHAMTADEILGVSKKEPQEEVEAPVKEVIMPELPKVEVEKAPDEAPIGDEQTTEAEEFIKRIKEDTLKRVNNAAENKAEPKRVEEPKEVPPQPVVEEKPQPKRMSPKAQELYDRMMAERAKNQMAKESGEKPQADTYAKTVEEVPSVKPTYFDEVPTPEVVAPTPKDEAPTPSPDDIFNTLSLSLGGENPLSLKKNTFSNSLLDKCRNYVTPQTDGGAKADSIDSIIHSAEADARKRLADFYENTEKAADSKYDFSRFGEDTVEEENVNNKEIEETQVVEPPKAEETAPVINITKTLGGSEQSGTRVIDFMSGGSDDIPHIKDTAQMEALRHNLRKLAEDTMHDISSESAGIKVNFTGIEEDELPENDISSYGEEADELDDYNSIEDAESVKADLDAKKVSIIGRLIPTSIITVLLLIIDYIAKDTIITASPALFVWLNAVLMVIGIVLNFNTLKGLAGIAFGGPDMDTPAALAFSATAVYTLITMIGNTMATNPVILPIGMLTLTFNLIGKRMLIKRISRGFSVIANDDDKFGVTFVEDKVCASVMARGSVMGEVLITVGKKTRNITNYLKNSYSEDAYEKKLFPLTIFTLIAGAVLALVGFFSGGSLVDAFCSFALVTLAACPPSSLLICNLPFSAASKKLKNYGAMIAGHEAVDAIANANAVAFKAADLFPKGTIKLYNMQVITNGAVDKYISYAASVLTSAQSPLAHVFKEILETAETSPELPEADTIKYENNMGVSGWVDEHRIFVGNRTLMEGHNILTPSLELDKKILREGYFPLYFAIDGELCALFIVGYEADEEITYELRRLCNTGVTMLVTNNDPNISDAMLCDYFGLYPDSIKVLNSSGATAYSQVSQFRENLSAPASYLGDIKGFLAAITASIRMKGLIDFLVVLQIIFICLGIATVGYFAAVGALLKMPLVLFTLGQLLTAFICYVITKFKQP